MQDGGLMIHLKVSKEEAEKALNYVQHEKFHKAIVRNWYVDAEGAIDGRSICWLYCWAKTGLNSQDAAMKARQLFNELFDVSFDRFDAKVNHQWARDARYDKDRRAVEAELEGLFS
jgi:hypothetical protein